MYYNYCVYLLQESGLPDEGEAERSSKEEEFLAICGLHGVSLSSPLPLQLKALEAEYHSLKEAGQTHKAEHVQSLHAWKSKKILEESVRFECGVFILAYSTVLYTLSCPPYTRLVPTLWTVRVHYTEPRSSYKMLSVVIPPTLSPAIIWVACVCY